MPQAPTWEETVAVPSWEDTVDESQTPEPKETEQEFVQRMGKPIVPTKAQLNEPRSPKELFEPFKKIPRVDSNDPRFRAAVSGALGQPASEDALSSVAAILNSAAGFVEGIESPAGVATAAAGPLGKVAQKLAALGWGAYSAAQLPEAARTAGELSVTGTPQEKKEAYLGLAGSIAIPAAIGAGVVGESPARGLAREISQAVPKFEDTSPIPITEQATPSAPPQGMVGLKDLTPQSEAAAVAAPEGMVGEPTTKLSPQAEAAVQEVIQKTAPILPRAAKEAAVSVEEQARLQKELAEELGQEPAVDQIVPAIKTMSGEVVSGEKGQSHNDIIEQNKIPAKEVDRREFVDTATGQEVSREKLATAIPTKKEGEAHSSDLAKAQEAQPPPPTPAPVKAEPSAPPPPAQPKGETQPFEVDDKLIMRSPHTGEDTVVSYRGKLPNGQAVVWTGKSQFPVPMEWLRRQGETYEEPKPTTTPTVAEKPMVDKRTEAKAGTEVSKPLGKTGGAGTRSYMGYTIESTPKAVQVGYSTETRLFSKGRRIGGFNVTDPEGYTRHFDTLKAAKKWIDDNPVAPPTPPPVEQKGVGPATGEGPGATVAGPTGIDPKAQIEQLADSFRNIEGQKLTIGEKLKQAFQVGERLSGAKDALSKALDGLKSAGNYLIGKWNQVQNIDDLLRAKGDLSAALETRGWRVRQWEKLAKKATPSLRDQAAIAKYVDAGGDMAELQRGFTEAPPKYKQAYQDAMNLKGDLKIAAENIRNYFDSRLQEAIEAGVLEHGVEDYIHRIYESKPKVAKKLFAYVQTGLLQKNPALTKKRIFQFDWEAEKLGYKPVQSYIPRIAQYESSLARAIAAREFIKKATTMRAADGRPVIDIKGVGIPIEDPSGVREATLIKPQFNPANKNQPGTPNYRGDYVNKEFPALSRWKWVAQDSNGKPIFVQGDVAIHPDYVNRVAALLEPSRVRYGRYGAVARPALNIGSAVKQTMLDLSGFHQVQTTVHGLEHRINPLNLVQEIDFNNPDVDGLLKGGVTLGGDYRMQAEGLAGAALTRHIPFLGPALESYHQWLFQDYIPRLKMTMALHALERNKVRYSGVKSPEEIYHQTASEANAAFGEQNYIILERSKTAQDMARLILLAPDFLEARGRFAGQSLTKGGKAFGNEQRTALLLGALTMYVTARILNKATTGQYHNEPENLFSVVHNGKAYGLRTVQGDILHLIEHPLQFWMHRLNPVFGRTTLEMATGRDEFGRKRSMPEQLWDFASTVMPISLRTSRERSIWESLANSFGINARRWQDTDDAFKLAKDWKSKHGIGERGEFIYDRDKDPLRPLKLALTSQDEGAAVKEIKKLIQSKTYTIPKLNDYFRRYASMPFTGSRANDVAWKRTLSEDQLKTVDAAKQHKESIRQLYMKALAKVYAE